MTDQEYREAQARNAVLAEFGDYSGLWVDGGFAATWAAHTTTPFDWENNVEHAAIAIALMHGLKPEHLDWSGI